MIGRVGIERGGTCRRAGDGPATEAVETVKPRGRELVAKLKVMVAVLFGLSGVLFLSAGPVVFVLQCLFWLRNGFWYPLSLEVVWFKLNWQLPPTLA
jgi:hypothetical protein